MLDAEDQSPTAEDEDSEAGSVVTGPREDGPNPVVPGMTMRTHEQIAAFFAEFEQASQQQAWDRYGALFLPDFLSADPISAGVVAREALISFLPHRKAIFERAGATGTTLIDLDVDQLDDRHALAKTAWAVNFDHDHAPVVLRSTFLLRREDRWRIALYLNHGNLLELLGLPQP